MWWIWYGYYVMLMCGGRNSWFCKASLIIFYVSLFECKGPWMLKNVINCHVWNRGLQNLSETVKNGLKAKKIKKKKIKKFQTKLMTWFSLKSPKTMFWVIFDHFWSFLPDGIFSKKSGSVTHNFIWVPNTMLSFRKK